MGGKPAGAGGKLLVYAAHDRLNAARKILIADDEPSIVVALEFLLRSSGFEVCIARNGDEALRLVESVVPDLVLLDVMMPMKSGYEVCKLI